MAETAFGMAEGVSLGYVYLVNVYINGSGLHVPLCTTSLDREKLTKMMEDASSSFITECRNNPDLENIQVESDINCGFVNLSYHNKKENKDYEHSWIVSTCKVV